MDTTSYRINQSGPSRAIYTSLQHGAGGKRSMMPVRPTTTFRTRGSRYNPVQLYRSVSTREVRNPRDTAFLFTQGFTLLKQKQWRLAVSVFQGIHPKSAKEHENKIIGLARALYPQSSEKAKDALGLLNQLSDSTHTKSLLLTKSRVLQVLEHNKDAEELLIRFFNKEGGDLTQSKPCKNHETNLTLARHWQIMGKHSKAKCLLQQCLSDNMLGDVQKDNYQLALSILHSGTNEFDYYIGKVTTGADKALSQSIHKLSLYCEHVVNKGSNESLFLDQALNCVEEAMQLSPSREKQAQLLSQKAHIMRIQNKPESEWKALFHQASCLDPSRELKEKTEPWREKERQALKKLNILN